MRLSRILRAYSSINHEEIAKYAKLPFFPVKEDIIISTLDIFNYNMTKNRPNRDITLYMLSKYNMEDYPPLDIYVAPVRVLDIRGRLFRTRMEEWDQLANIFPYSIYRRGERPLFPIAICGDGKHWIHQLEEAVQY